jgi:hypothetical protein
MAILLGHAVGIRPISHQPRGLQASTRYGQVIASRPHQVETARLTGATALQPACFPRSPADAA